MRTRRLAPNLLLACILAAAAAPAIAHEDDDANNIPGVQHSRVAIHTDGDKRVIESNGVPNHRPGQFPNPGNPNSISPQKYKFEMRVKPQQLSELRAIRRYLFGVAVNGVVFDPGTAEVWSPGDKIVSHPGRDTRMGPDKDPSRIWNYEGMGRMNLGIDSSHAHVQPTGAYHYHGLPTGLIDQLNKHVDESLRDSKPKADAPNRDANASLGETRLQSMLLIGYAADGYPIYAETGYTKAEDATSPLKKLKSSYHLKTGNRPTGDNGPGGKYDGTFVQDYEFKEGSGDLDKANGREGVTPEYAEGTYYYVVTEEYPFIPRYFHGEPDKSFEKQMGPPGGPGGPGGPFGPGGPPPRGGRRPPPPR